ncbi:polysaccharide deacetylase family protein [Xanthomonas campestris pv. campestris]|nr:polysaccharide deacetylase family protein [Xanthomonas campestris pv. campestris]
MTRLTLTFDNGPTPGITDHVLSVLDRFGVKATFFLVGSRLRTPDGARLARRAHEAGHWLGNHTLSHGEPLGLQHVAGAAQREIGEMEALLGDLAHPDRLFRPNGKGRLGPHLLNPEAVVYLRTHAGTVVLWDSVPLDRKVDVPSPDSWLAQAKRDVLVRPWTLMVLHDRPSGHQPEGPMNHLADFLGWARDQGVEFVQEFPDHCVPIRRGEVRLPLDDIVAQAQDSVASQ